MIRLTLIVVIFLLAGCEPLPIESSKTISSLNTTINTGTYIVEVASAEHDGHKWVVSSKGGIVHHPDCPCHK
jgi:hypothetical protein